jgi:hypothetical protein
MPSMTARKSSFFRPKRSMASVRKLRRRGRSPA